MCRKCKKEERKGRMKTLSTDHFCFVYSFSKLVDPYDVGFKGAQGQPFYSHWTSHHKKTLTGREGLITRRKS